MLMLIKESLSTTMHCVLEFVYTYGNCAIKYDNYSHDMISTALPVQYYLKAFRGGSSKVFVGGAG
jgi:hypothetical protein